MCLEENINEGSMWACEMSSTTKNISTATMPLASNLGRAKIYLELILTIRSLDILLMWYGEITPVIKKLYRPCYNDSAHQAW